MVARAYCCGVLLLLLPVASQGEATGPATSKFIDVPYVADRTAPGSEPALAMVLRYWHTRHGNPSEASAALTTARRVVVDPADLQKAIERLGWQAKLLTFTADNGSPVIESYLSRGYPVIALTEPTPRVRQYVVIVGATPEAVVLHDPARGPFRVVTREEFARQTTSGPLLVVLPPQNGANESSRDGSVSADNGAADTACRALVDAQVRLARAADPATAQRTLRAATTLCGDDAAAWRERAAVEVLASDWAAAAASAGRAVELAPDDADAWRLLATARYLQDDLAGAVEAWNRVGEPRAEAVNIHGLQRIPESVVRNLADVEPRTLLTHARISRAMRRLALLPGASQARIAYVAAESGVSAVDIHIKERSRAPRSMTTLGTIGGRAILSDEIKVDFANLAGRGEVVGIGYRWSGPRTRLMGQLDMPIAGIPGIVTMEGMIERQSYLIPADGNIFVEHRNRAGATVTDWATGWLRWSAGAAFDRIRSENFLGLDAGVDVRAARDHLSFIAAGSRWLPAGTDAPAFQSGILAFAWRTSTGAPAVLFYGDLGVAAASAAAPFAVWPGAHTSADRGGSLRAHPLRQDDIVSGPVFGRRLAFGSVTSEQKLADTKWGRLALAEFADVGQAWQRLPGLLTSPLHVDIGIGVRLTSAKMGGILRADIAHGVRDGRRHFSAGYARGWPGR